MIDNFDTDVFIWTEAYNCGEILVKHRIHKTSAFNAQGNHLKVNNLINKYK